MMIIQRLTGCKFLNLLLSLGLSTVCVISLTACSQKAPAPAKINQPPYVPQPENASKSDMGLKEEAMKPDINSPQDSNSPQAENGDIVPEPSQVGGRKSPVSKSESVEDDSTAQDDFSGMGFQDENQETNPSTVNPGDEGLQNSIKKNSSGKRSAPLTFGERTAPAQDLILMKEPAAPFPLTHLNAIQQSGPQGQHQSLQMKGLDE